jgi:aminopeptidase N
MLKHLLVFGLIGLFVTSRAQHNIDVLHYKFEIGLNDNNDTIYGKALITFKFLQPASSVSFDLSVIKNKKGMSVGSVSFNDMSSSAPGVEHLNDKIVIRSSSTYKTGDTSSVTINYKGIPSDGLIISKNKYGHRTFFADNWPNRGHNWMPCVDDPADKASVEFIVTAPEHYQVVANGIVVEETNLPDNKKLTHWKEDVPIAPKVMVIGAADFAVSLASIVNNCIPVYSWVYPEDRDKGFYDYALAADILPFFIKNVGPYGYKKLANVQSKTTFGGLENANTIFYSENSVTGNRKSEETIVHEIAHQWFGNMATETSFAHLWLSEGFATYMTTLYMESKYGADKARTMLIEDRDEVIEFAKKSDQPVIDESTDYMKLLNANNYQKGGWILHMLRRQLGDSIFWKSVQKYYSNYAGKNADSHDLQLIFEKVSGKNLSVFFKQWLYMPGIPKLDLTWNYLTKDQKVSVTVKQLQKNAFAFPLDLSLTGVSGKNQAAVIYVSKQEETFLVSVKEKTTDVILDPKTSLLFDGMAIEKK